MRSIVIFAAALSLLAFSSAFKPELNTDPCPPNVAVSDFVIADEVVIAASGTILSAQSILENSTVVYRSGSGTLLSFSSMTGSLTGPSPNFQIYPGSMLTVEIVQCVIN
jgi:hypothetical protein